LGALRDSQAIGAGPVNGPVLAIFADVSIRSHLAVRAFARSSAGGQTKGEAFVGLMLRGASKAGASRYRPYDRG